MRPDVEELNSATVRSASREQSLANLLEQVTRTLDDQGTVDVEVLARAHPQHAERLRELMPTMQAMASWGQAPNSGAQKISAAAVGSHPGGVLGDFRIIRELGHGGMGVVYLAEQVSLQREVALKIMPMAAVLDPRQLQRFKNEVQAVALLQHQNIVPVYFVGSDRGVHYYAMRYVEGHTLGDVIAYQRHLTGIDADDQHGVDCDGRLSIINQALTRDSQPPAAGDTHDDVQEKYGRSDLPLASPAAETDPIAALSTATSKDHENERFRSMARLTIQAAEALDHAHSRGILHRDVKPGNLMVDATSNLWITDFGLARIEADAGLTMTGDIVGTLRYMSPEQALAKRAVVDHRTDIYSLGATFYELLALRPAYAGRDRQELLNEITLEDPQQLRQVNGRIPVDLETIVGKAMEKNPVDRYETAQELADDLRRYLGHEAIHATPPTVRKRLAKWSRRNRPLVAVAVAIAIAAALLGGTVAWSQSQRRLEVEKMVGESWSAARAFMQSKDYNSAQQRLAEAQVRLDESGENDGPIHANVAKLTGEVKQKLQAQQQFDKFQQLRRRALELFGGYIGPQEQQYLREALALYQVLDGVKIENLPDFQNLDSRAQTQLREGIAESLFRLAISEIQYSSYRRAIDLLSQIETVLQPTRGALLHISRCWRILGEEELAAQAEERAREITPETVIDYFMLSASWDPLGPSNLQALDYLYLALDLRPDDIHSFSAAAWTHQRLNQWAESEAMYTGYIALNPLASWGYVARARARLAQHKIDLAERDLAKAAKLEPVARGRAVTMYGSLLERKGKFAEALEMYDKVLSLNKWADWTRSVRATLYHTLGDYDKAAREFTVMIEQRESSIDLGFGQYRHYFVNWHVDRAFVYADAGKPDLARADITTALSVDTSTVESRLYLAWFLATCSDPALRDPQQALALARRIVERAKESGTIQTPKGAEYWLTLGIAHYRMGDFASATSSFNEARQLDRHELDLVAYGYFAAMSHWRLGQQDVARDWYDRTVKARNWRCNAFLERHVANWQLPGFRDEAAKLLGIKPNEENPADNSED